MSNSITRRTFVEAAALGTAAVALAAGASGSFQKMEPAWANQAPVVKKYSTSCHGCIQVCPCNVYTEDDVVVKIEGNKFAPVSLGGMCVKGLSQIHTCYSPRRVLYPLKRTGARGAENSAWERLSWDDAIELATSKMAEIIEKYGTYSFVGGGGGGGAYTQQESRATPRTLGSPNVFEPGAAQCYLPRTILTNLTGIPYQQSIADGAVVECFKGLSIWEQEKGIVNETKGIVLWGAQPSVSQTSQSGRGMAEIRAKGCKTVVVDPNMTPDAVKADIWLRVRPGADTGLILSWYRYIIENKLYNEKFTKFFTNLPMIINPDTDLPFYATDIFPDYQQTAPLNTPAFVCYDNITQSLQPLEFGDPDLLSQTIDPEIFWKGEINGVTCETGGQVYKSVAEPWTLEEAERVTWVPAGLNEAAIRMYTNADNEITPVEGGVPFGLVCGVAAEQQTSATNVIIGCLGLDMMMGYVNKRGATITAKRTRGYTLGNLTEVQKRATFSEGQTNTNGVGYVVGATPEENAARVEEFEDQSCLYAMNQLVLDRLGTRNHKGLNHWWHSHIPSVLEAIKTGIPYKPRLWYDVSGNKLAMLASAESWYNVFPEVDYVIAQHPMMTSFHMETADLFFPLVEWLETPNAGKSQLNYTYGQFPIIHLGETTSNLIPAYHIVYGTSQKLNDRLDEGAEILFGYVGASTGPGPAVPSSSSVAVDDEKQTSPNATWYHERDLSKINMRFPFTKNGLNIKYSTDAELYQVLANTYATQTGLKAGDITFEELRENYDEYREKMDAGISEDTGWCQYPSKDYWQYEQHLTMCDDGMPLGFTSESRKLEVYVTALIKMAATGFPHAYPRQQEPCDPSLGEEIAAYNPMYEKWVGRYSPVCQYVEPPESVLKDHDNYSEEYPLAMTNGRVYYFHHGTMRHAPFIRELYPAPDVRMNPTTAANLGIEHMDWVEVTSRRGSIRGRAYLTAGMHEDAVLMERFWNPECYDSSQKNVTGGWRESNCNVISKNTAPYDSACGSYNCRAYAVNVKKAEKPAGVWEKPEEFQPFMPSNAIGWHGFDASGNGIGSALDLPQSPLIELSTAVSLPE